MNRFLPIVCFILFFFTFSFGQQTEIDSIEYVLSQLNDDASISKKLNETCVDLRKGNPDIHLHFIHKSLKHSKETNDTVYLAAAYNELGTYYTYRRVADSAILMHQIAYKLFNEINHASGICKTYINLGNAYSQSNELVESINQNLKAIKCMEEKNDSSAYIDLLRAKSNLGIQYMKMNEFEKAKKYWTEVISDSVVKKDRSFYGSIALNMSILNRKLKKPKESIKYGLIAVETSNKPRTLSKTVATLGTAYTIDGQFDKAYECFLKAVDLNKQLKDSIGIQRAYHNIGYMFKAKGDLKTATKYYLSSNEEIKKRGDLQSLRKSYQGLAAIYVAQKDYKTALEYTRLHYSIIDSISGIEKQKAVADYEVKYETEKTKREKDLAETKASLSELESKQNRNLFFGAILIAGLILLSSLFYFSRLKANKKAELALFELNETQNRLLLEKQHRDSELKALKAQMNPHFIFNALTSIQEYVMQNRTRQASDYLAQFADLIRNNLNYSDTGLLSINEEVENLKLYLDLEKLRFEDKLDYTINVDKNLDTNKTDIPTMLIQPYIENALKHGLLHKPDNRRLKIDITKLSDHTIECTVEDNGIGREQSAIIKNRQGSFHKSFATKATAERLELLNHGKDTKVSVEIIDLKESTEALGTRVVLRIPTVDRFS